MIKGLDIHIGTQEQGIRYVQLVSFRVTFPVCADFRMFLHMCPWWRAYTRVSLHLSMRSCV